MVKKKKLFSLCIALFVVSNINPAFSQGETAKIFTVGEFIYTVKQFHPLAKQAALIPQQAKAELLIAQGGWDPRIYSDYNNKTFDGNNYYSFSESKVSIPTWYGVEIKAGYDFAYGSKLNNESILPKNGLGYLGLSVPLVKNLLFDKQRAALQQAKIFREASEQQRILLLNDLLLDALTAYYEWSYAYNEYSVYKEAVRIAQIRFEATKKAVEFGDRAAIDTTEALTQLQSTQFQTAKARLNFVNTGLELCNYLWLENNLPRAIDTTIIPAPLQSDFLKVNIQLTKLDELVAQLTLSHPALLNYNFKIRQLNVDLRLKTENLKPTLNASYNVLSERFDLRSKTGSIFTNNYKFGLNLFMPLTFMQSKGELKLTKLKIQETKLAVDYKQQELLNKLKAYFNELIYLQQQTHLYEQTMKGFKQLLDGENTRLKTGESSLFLVNIRENRYLESQIKLGELQSKYFKTEAALKWAAGNIYDELFK